MNDYAKFYCNSKYKRYFSVCKMNDYAKRIKKIKNKNVIPRNKF